jgi:hypothetical protein
MKKTMLIILVLAAVVFASCSDADVASANLSRAADQFEVFRRAVFYNGITGEYILTIEGFLSILDEGGQLEVTVKADDGTFLKHFLGLSDNVTYFVEQIEGRPVSEQRYRVVFKPSVIVPDIDLE